MTDLTGRTVLVVGATSTSGLAAARALLAAGAHVVATGRDAGRLDTLAAELGAAAAASKAPWSAESAAESPSADGGLGSGGLSRADAARLRTAACDPTQEDAVAALAAEMRGAGVRIDGILHLVGGWRGGGGLPGQSDADYRVLEAGLTSLRHVTRAFWDDLVAASAARVAIVSSTAVARPLAGGANYAAVKAAMEAWTRAVAQGFAKSARDAGEPLRAGATIVRVASLAGLEDALADAYVGLWDADAADVNDTVVDLRA